MSGHPKLDAALVAGSTVVTVDQLMQAIKDHNEHHPEDEGQHYLKAAIAGAIAVGAYEALKKDDNTGNYKHHSGNSHGSHNGDHNKNGHEHNNQDNGHTRHLLEETFGAYALGRQAMGHNNHLIVKLIAEGLGAVGLYKEAKKDMA